MHWSSIVTSIVLWVGVPLALYIAQQGVNEYVRNVRLKRWMTGALSAAGKAYTSLLVMREGQPTAPLDRLVQAAVRQEADTFIAGYAQTAAAIGATPSDAISAVRGKLGEMLAADPTISIAKKAPANTNVPAS